MRKRAEKPADGKARVFHELEVHQIELEMQNAELEAARNSLEAALERYTDLYDFAPVGYFTVAETGVILEANLTGAALLGLERSRLINRNMQSFVAPTSRPSFLAYLKDAFSGPMNETRDALIRKEGGDTFWASVRALLVASGKGARQTCRVAFTDITLQRQNDAARRHLVALGETNVGLLRDIVKRKALETALRKNEVQKSRLLELAHRAHAQSRLLAHRVLGAQEEERRRISRELHDVVAQTLVGVNVHLEMLNVRAARKPADLKKAIIKTQRLVAKTVDHVHRFAKELRPSALDHLGLIPTLRSLLDDFAKQTSVRTRFTARRTRGIEGMDSATRTALYRVAQEALSNVAKHARATIVYVSIEANNDAVRLRVRDNGKSFDVARQVKAKQLKRLGLIGMRERMEMVGGSFDLKSAPGEGTTVTADVPTGVSPRSSPRS